MGLEKNPVRHTSTHIQMGYPTWTVKHILILRSIRKERTSHNHGMRRPTIEDLQFVRLQRNGVNAFRLGIVNVLLRLKPRQ